MWFSHTEWSCKTLILLTDASTRGIYIQNMNCPRSVFSSRWATMRGDGVMFRFCMFITLSPVHYLPAVGQVSLGQLPASSERRGMREIVFSTSAIRVSDTSLKLSSKSFMRCRRHHLSSLQRIWTNSSEWDFTGTFMFFWSHWGVFL